LLKATDANQMQLPFQFLDHEAFNLPDFQNEYRETIFQERKIVRNPHRNAETAFREPA